MYEKHFGLKSRPFRSRTDASGVFVGPAQVKLISSLKKAFAASDAIVTVTGPVGVGKSTVVNRALEGIGDQRIVAQVGRMQLAADEVLELLLTEFNVSRQPNGTIQRFAAFKRLLHEWAAAGTRAFIIVEDADRIGSDALIELEALTASDSSDGAGAGIVLMGQPTLAERIAHPDLARLRQRIRLRHVASPFSAAETQGYLKHCIRNAGGEFDNVFDPAAVDMLYRCSEGIPRVINNLCESVLAAAAEANASLVLPQLVQHIAHEEFGLQPGSKTAERTLPAAPAAPDLPTSIADVAPKSSTATPPPEMASKAVTESAKATPKVAVAPTAARADVTPPVVEARRTVTAEVDRSTDPATAKTAAIVSIPHVDDDPDDAESDTVTTAEGFEPVPVSSFTTEPETRPVPKQVKAAPVATPAKSAEQPAVTALPEKPPENVPPPAVSKPVDIAVTAPALPEDDNAKPAKVSDTLKDDVVLDEIPELIQDTQPALAALAVEDDLPDLTDLVVPAPAKVPKTPQAACHKVPTAVSPAKNLSSDDIPTLSSELRIEKKRDSSPPQAPVIEKSVASKPPVLAAVIPAPAVSDEAEDPKSEATITEIPSWDRDPTLAELKPDIAALEAELAAVPEPSPVAEAKKKPAPPPEIKAKKDTPSFDLPEITLEKELKVREIEAQELLRQSARPDAHEAGVDEPVKRKHGFDLDKIAAELGKARSLEDVDDKLAETLFGEEMATAAAEIAAMVAANEPDSPLAGAALELLNDTAPATGTAAPAPAKVSAEKPEPPGKAAPGNASAPAVAQAAPEAAPPEAPASPAIEITLQSRPDPDPPAADATPEPIEEQFGTSMTATLKALSAAQVQEMDESANDQEEKPARKLFGLFRGGN